jgi:hypothetical protein
MTAATGNTGYHVVVVSGEAAGWLASASRQASTRRLGCMSAAAIFPWFRMFAAAIFPWFRPYDTDVSAIRPRRAPEEGAADLYQVPSDWLSTFPQPRQSTDTLRLTSMFT